ncbi:MAG: TIGR04086 family membrane protein [Clostridia bacterium]
MKKIKQYSISMIVSFAIAIILLCVTGAIFAYTNIADRHLSSFIFGIVMLCVLIGSTILSRKIKEKGLLHGAIFGFLFCILVYFFTVIAYTGFFISNTLGLYLAISVLSGVIGGIIGVNIK